MPFLLTHSAQAALLSEARRLLPVDGNTAALPSAPLQCSALMDALRPGLAAQRGSAGICFAPCWTGE